MCTQKWNPFRKMRFFCMILVWMTFILNVGHFFSMGYASDPTYRVNYPGSSNLPPGTSEPEFSSDPAPVPEYKSSTATPGSAQSPLRDSSQSTIITPAQPPVAPSSESLWSRTDLLLGPKNVIARPGSEVILTAGLRDSAGYLRTNQRIDWTIEPDSVGHFSKIQEREFANILVFDFVKPQILSDTQAVTTTSRSELILDRGTPNLNDDIVVRRGESWISVTSPREGVTSVTASAGKQSDGICRSQSSRIIWVDAAVKLPESRVLDFGSSCTLTTALRHVSNEKPLYRWRVRYEIDECSAAVFNDGNKMLEVYTDYQGEAKVTMKQQPVARQEKTVVNVKIIRPADEDFKEPVIVQDSRLHFLWKPNTINIQKTMPKEVLIGEIVPATIWVTNLTSQPLQNIRIVDMVQPGLVLKGAVPEGKDAPDGHQWLLESIPANTTYTIQLNYRVEQPGSYLSRSWVQTQKMGNDLVVECSAPVSAGSDTSPYKPNLPNASGQNDSGPVPTFESDDKNQDSKEGDSSFDSSTKPLPPPEESEDVYQPNREDAPPASLPLSGRNQKKEEEKDSEVAAQSPKNAPVFPPVDPEALIGLNILAPAKVKKGEVFDVEFNINNRMALDQHEVDIQVGNSNGLSNRSTEGDLNYVERVIDVLPQEKMTQISASFLPLETGTQIIEVTIRLSNGKEYNRGAKVEVLEGNETGTSAIPQITPPGNTAPEEEKSLETPAVESPDAETPAVESPAVESPTVETPAVESPATKKPAAGTPAAETPGIPAVEPDLEIPSIPPLQNENESTLKETRPESATEEEKKAEESAPFSITLKESKAEIKVGDSFDYSLAITNKESKSSKNVEVFFVIAPTMAEVQKDAIKGPVKAEVTPEDGLVHFAVIPEIASGKSVQCTIPVKALKAGSFRPHVKILENGTPKAEKEKETQVR